MARISTKTSPHDYGKGGICIVNIRGTKKYQYTYFLDGKKFRRYFKCDDDGLKEARAFRDQINENKQKGITGTTKSLYEMIQEYLIKHKEEVTEAAIRRNFNTLFALYTHNEKFLNQKFDTISPLDVENAIYNMRKKISVNEARKAFLLLNAVFHKAVGFKIISENPCDALNCPDVNTPEKTIFTNEEVIKVFSAIRFMKTDPMYHLSTRDYFTLVMLLFGSGVRINEGLSTMWRDITESDGTTYIHIQRTLDSHHTGGGQVTKIPKTASGNRFIPLPLRLVRRLNKIRPKNDTGYIFPTSSGTAIDCHNFYRTWYAILRATARECPSCHTKRPNFWKCSCGNLVAHNAKKCPKCKSKRPISWTCPTCGTVVTEVAHKIHEIRHNYASVLANKYNYPDTIIAGWLGHKSVAVLRKTYMHKPPNYGSLLDGVFNKKGKPKKT